MKKTFAILLFIVLFFNPSPLYANKKHIIAGDRNNPPYEYIDENGDYVGFNIDILRAISLEMGIDFHIVPMDWMEAHKKLIDGDIFAIQGMSYNDERKKIYSFSDSYIDDALILFTKKNNRSIYNLNSLKGKKVSIQRHGLGAYIISELGETEITFSNDLKESFRELDQGSIDALLANKASALNTIKELNLNKDIKVVEKNVTSIPYGIAFNKYNDDLVDEFNKAIATIKYNGTYEKIYEKWFGDIDYFSQHSNKYVINLLFAILCVALAFIVIIFLFNRSLKKNVKSRTKEIEESNRKLLESYVYREQILNSIGNGLIIIDTNNIISNINAQVEKFFSIDTSKDIGLPYNKSNIIRFFDLDMVEDAILNQKTFYSLNSKILVDEEEFIYAYNIYPFLNKDNINIGSLIVIKDLTEITRLRYSLNQKDKLESIGVFVSSIAHEIRNPLTAIKNYIDLLPLKYENPIFREKITEQIPKEIGRLNSLLTDLLDYSKPRESKPEILNLKDLIYETKHILNHNFQDKAIELSIDIDENIVIYSDKYQAKQVLINILLNSIDSIKGPGGFVAIKARFLDKYVMVSIDDNGSGISKEQLKNIFDPFYTTKEKGTGLGLATSYNIIKENCGYLEPVLLDKGTRINIYFKEGYQSE